MWRHLRSNCLVSWMAIGVVLSVAASAGAQVRTSGQVTDEWDNPLEGATVLIERTDSNDQQTTTTDEDGRFLFVGLASGDWSFTATLDGYQGIRTGAPVRQLGNNPPVNFELPAVPAGGAFSERTEFEAAGGTPRFRFEQDGTFEFEDAEGEGEGTYAILEQAGILTVREYDGPDDKFNVNTPLVVDLGNQMTSMTHDGVQLQWKQ